MINILKWVQTEFGGRMGIYVGLSVLIFFGALLLVIIKEARQAWGIPFLIACIFWVIVTIAIGCRSIRRGKEHTSMLREIDQWLADKSSHYETLVIHLIRDFVEQLKSRLLEYFKDQPDKIREIERIYKKLYSVDAKYRDILIDSRYLLDPNTNISRPISLGISYEDKSQSQREGW